MRERMKLKRVVAMVLFAIMTLSSTLGNIAFAGSNEMIENGSFDEATDSLSGWSVDGDVVVVENGGTYAKLTGSDENALLQSQSTSAEAEANVKLTFSVKLTSNAYFRATVLQYNGSAESAAGNLIVSLPEDVASGEWQSVEYIFQTAADVTALAVAFEVNGGVAMVDKVSMKNLYRDIAYQANGTQVAIENSSFEKGLDDWTIVDGQTESLKEGYDGKGVAITTTDHIGRLVQDGISLESNSLYELHYYIKATDAATYKSSVVIEVIDDGELRRIQPCYLEGNSDADGWQEMTAQFTTGNVEGEASVKLTVESTDSSVGETTVAYDEILLTQLTDNSNVSLMSLRSATLLSSSQNTNLWNNETVKWGNKTAESYMELSTEADDTYGTAFKLTGKQDNASTTYIMQNPIAWEAGKTYIVTYYVKTDANIGNYRFLPRVNTGAGVYYTPNNGLTWSTSKPSDNKKLSEWTKYSFEVTIAKSDTTKSYMEFQCRINKTGDAVYFAGVTIEKKLTGFTNGTFTEGTKDWNNITSEQLVDGQVAGAKTGQVLQVTKPASQDVSVTHVEMTKPVEAGTKYTLKFRTRNSALTHDGNGSGSVYFKTADNAKVADTEYTLYPTNGVWSDVVIDFTPEVTYTDLTLCLDMTGTSEITYCFADFSFGEYQTIVLNDDFEKDLTGWTIQWAGSKNNTYNSQSSIEVAQDDTYGTVMKMRKYKSDKTLRNGSELLTDVYLTLNEELEVGRVYQIRLKMKNSVAIGSDDASTVLYIKNGQTTTPLLNETEGTGDEWKEYTLEYTVEEGWETPTLFLRLNNRGTAEYIDYHFASLQIERTDKTSSALLRNGNFNTTIQNYPAYWGAIGETLQVTDGVAVVTKEANKTAGITTLLTVYESATHVIEFDLKANEAARKGLKLRLTPYREETRQSFTGQENLEPELQLKDTDDWQRVSVTFDVATGIDYMDFSLFCQGESAAEFQIDNVSNGFDEITNLNFDFEVGRETPISWSCTAGLFQRAEGSYDGSHAAMISNSRGGRLTSNMFTLKPATNYELSYWIKADQDYNAGIYAKINQKQSDGTTPAYSWTYSATADDYRIKTDGLMPTAYNYTFGTTITTENPEGWQFVRMTFYTSEDAGMGNVQFILSGSASEVWIDSVRFNEIQDNPNMDFEDADADGNPENWYLGSVRNTSPQMQVVSDVYHSGDSSLYINSDSLYGSMLSSAYLIPINTVGNRAVYEFSFWSASRSAETGTLQMELWYYDEDKVKIYNSAVANLTASLAGLQKTLNSGSERSEWSQTITRSAIPEDAKYVKIVFRLNDAAGEVWIDDLRFAQVEADNDIIAAYNDFHAKDQNGNIGEWDAVDTNMKSVSGAMTQESDSQEGFYGKINAGSNAFMRYRTNTLGTGYAYTLTIRYKSDTRTNVEFRFNNYKNEEYESHRLTHTLDAALDWTEATIDFVAPSAVTCDMLFGLQGSGDLCISNIVLWQTDTPKDKITWQGQWLCYKNDYRYCQEYSHSYYRHEVELTDEATFAPFQFTADDCMVLYVNGEEVFNNVNDSLQTWANVQLLYLEEYLKKGTNTIAFDVYNQSAYSSILYDGIWTLKNGEQVTCLSGADTVCWSEEYDGNVASGWYKENFDDSAWSSCYLVGPVGISPWGSLVYDSSLYIDNKLEIKVAEGEDAVVNDLVYEFSIDIKTEKEITENVPMTMVLWKRNSTRSICKITPTILTNGDMKKWPAGEWVNVKMRVELPDYLDAGYYTLQLDDTYFAVTNEDLYDGRFISFKVLNNYQTTSLTTKVEDVNGVPTYTINGTPQSGLWLQLPPFNSDITLETSSDSGMEVYLNTDLRLGEDGNAKVLWQETGAIDFDAVDETINSALSASQDSYMIVTLSVVAPQWWLDENPDEVVWVSDAEGNYYLPGNKKTVSFGSTKWIEESSQALEDIIAHMKQQKYWGRVAGIKLIGGRTSEMMTYDAKDGHSTPDYSVAAQNYFKKWVKEKYGTIEKLRTAWNDPSIESFETIELPTFADMKAGGDYGILLDPTTQQKEIDFRLVLDEMTSDAVISWAKTVKEATDNKLIVGTYYGYLCAGGGWNGLTSTHTSVNKILQSEYIDFLASPTSYGERLFGESSFPQTPADSVRAYGKLYVSENDNRTVLMGQFAGASWDLSRADSIGKTFTMEDTVLMAKKDSVYNLVEGNAQWLFDMTGGWLADEQIYEFTRDANEEYDFANYVERDVLNDVAVIVPDDNAAYLRTVLSTDGDGALSLQTKLANTMYRNLRKELFQMGASFDTYAMSTLTEGKMPEHKINIFCSPYMLTEEARTAIDTYCKTNNQINVFLYMSGYGDEEGWSLENMNELTGFTFGLNNKSSSGQIIVTNESSEVTQGEVGNQFGIANLNSGGYLQEIYVMEETETIALGQLNDSGKIGFAMKEMDDWTSIYSAAPIISTGILRNLLKMADVHIYSEDYSDVVWANDSYVAVHSGTSGNKTIQLDGNYAVYDVFEEKYISMNTDVIEYYNKTNDTHLFRLTKADTLSFMTMVKGGHGSASIIGLQQVIPGSSQQITLTPDEGYVIKSVTVNGETIEIPADNTLTFTNINENKVIVVRFKREPVPIEEDDVQNESTASQENTAQTAVDTDASDEEVSAGTVVDDYEEIWKRIRTIFDIPTWLFWSIILAVTAVVVLVVYFVRKRKENREEKGV